ncbi:MAG: SDR family oxidoreductase [Armatimonadetes bacterium]|nr:SDR family oxidoreductase [Armatimonadota bacterium]
MTQAVIDRAGEEMARRIPMGRLGRSGEMKGVALFLPSEASSYITGQVICVDGGLTAM